MNLLEGDNKLVTYHSWFALPRSSGWFTHLCAEWGRPLMPPCYFHLDLPKHVTRNVSKFCLCAHTLAVESCIALHFNEQLSSQTFWLRLIVNLWRVILCCCAKWGACSFSLTDLYVRPPRKKQSFLFLSFCQYFLWRPLKFCMPCLVNQIIPFSVWDYGSFVSGWQCPASPAVNPSIWRSKPIVF